MGERLRRVVRHVGLAFAAGGGLLTGLSCGGGDIQAPTTGSIELTTATSGPEPDADGYAVSIDGGAETALGANASMQRHNLEPGDHSVLLGGMAANCTVEGQNPRSVSVNGDAVAEVSFVITCRATTGTLQVTSTTSGPSPDPDGYTITLDGTDRGALVVSGAVTIDGLTAGSHTVGLSGIAANCQVQGDNPRAANVTAGASATVAFAITCVAPPPVTGTLRIITSTTGPDRDPDGYAFAVDGGTSQPIGISATAALANVAAGAHTVRLSGLAGNCTVQGTNPRPVTVSAGATAEVRFAVSCSAATGTLEITTTTTGNTLDPDGYIVTVDNAAPQNIGASASLTVPGVSPGSHQVTLGGLATNCRVEGDNPRSVMVTAGATGTVSFSITCPGPQGSRIAFASERDQRRIEGADMYVVNDDGSNLARLTHGLDVAARGGEVPVWSPDASKIAFKSYNNHHQIYVVTADGSQLTQLTHTTQSENYSPAWSPDGSRLAFWTTSRSHSESGIFVMNADGSGRTKLADGNRPLWSPDGNKIAYLGGNLVAGDDFYVMNADGSGQTQLTSASINCSYLSSLSWSADGSKIAFVTCEDDYNGEIYVMNADGSAQTRLTANPAFDYAPSWSPDGRKIAFLRQVQNEVEVITDIYVMNPDGSGQTNLTNGHERAGPPIWSRDGHKIAFASGDIYVMNSDGTGIRNVTKDVAAYSDPAWAP